MGYMGLGASGTLNREKHCPFCPGSGLRPGSTLGIPIS
jgi:hypothetical protein